MENNDVRPGYLIIVRDERGEVEQLGRVCKLVTLFGTVWLSYISKGKTYYTQRDAPNVHYAAPVDD